MSEQPPSTPAPESERARRRRERRGTPWIVGVVLIILGLIFLAQNLGGYSLQNWWALFILIPAIASFATAYRSYKASGRLDRQARSALVGGLVLTAVSFVFLLGLDWGRLWPIFLIIVGLGALLNVLGD